MGRAGACCRNVITIGMSQSAMASATFLMGGHVEALQTRELGVLLAVNSLVC